MIIKVWVLFSLGEFYTDSEDIKNTRLLKKVEEISQNMSYSNNLSKDKLIQELLTHQAELEIQNGSTFYFTIPKISN